MKVSLDSIIASVLDSGVNLSYLPCSIDSVDKCGLQRETVHLALAAAGILSQEHPITLRGLFYRIVSQGFLPSTDKKYYTKIVRLLGALRKKGLVPFSWLVDNLRSSQKPSSWSGLEDFVEAVKQSYRKNFWAHLPEYVHILVEKDAVAATILPVTEEYDVALDPIRGYSSLTRIHEIAMEWNQIDKPIHAYYLGDFDPSGMDLERNTFEGISDYCDKDFTWTRLGVNKSDIEEFDLIKLAVKQSDTRAREFITEHADYCTELDALPATELRKRVESAICEHIPAAEWERLREIEKLERESFNAVFANFKSTTESEQ